MGWGGALALEGVPAAGGVGMVGFRVLPCWSLPQLRQSVGSYGTPKRVTVPPGALCTQA